MGQIPTLPETPGADEANSFANWPHGWIAVSLDPKGMQATKATKARQATGSQPSPEDAYMLRIECLPLEQYHPDLKGREFLFLMLGVQDNAPENLLVARGIARGMQRKLNAACDLGIVDDDEHYRGKVVAIKVGPDRKDPDRVQIKDIDSLGNRQAHLVKPVTTGPGAGAVAPPAAQGVPAQVPPPGQTAQPQGGFPWPS